MFKTTQEKTLVGNNKDYWNPNTLIWFVWFEQSEGDQFGTLYVGFDDF